MQAKVHGLKERINIPKLCFRVILIKDHERSFFIVFSLISLFDYSFLFVPFFQHFFFALAHFYFFYGVSLTSFGSLFSSHLPSSIRHLVAYSPLENIFCLCPLVQGVILGRVIERKLSGSKVKDGHFSFQTQLPKLKSNFLQEKNDLCLCDFLVIFFPHFFSSIWLS